MKMKRLPILVALLFAVLAALWYFDIGHDPVEPIEELIGHDYNYARKMYFRTEPGNHYTLNINEPLKEFDVEILNKQQMLTDSIVDVYTWEYKTYKKTIWVGETELMKDQVILAIRYNKRVEF